MGRLPIAVARPSRSNVALFIESTDMQRPSFIPAALPASLVLLATLAAPAAQAADDAARIAALEARIAALEARLAQVAEPAPAAAAVEAPPAAAPAIPVVDLAPLQAHAKASAWAERVQVRGDLRVRHDSLDSTGEDARLRERLRARLSVVAKLDEGFGATLAVASGNDDPISRNQTFDGGFNSKSINIEQAFVSWKPDSVPGLEMLAGKFRLPVRVEGDAFLVFDSDVNPEGYHVAWRRPIGDLTFFASGSAWWVDERSTSADTVLYGAQAGVRIPAGEGGEFVATLSNNHYSNLDGRPAIYEATGRGNRLVGGRYATGYNIVEVGLDWKGSIGPAAAALFGDWVRNTEADRFDTGYAVGGTLAHHGITLGYFWKSLEADAVLGVFADSDFGLGGTDVEGHQVSVEYDLNRAVNLRARWASVEHGDNAGVTQDADRILLDVLVRY
jgi:hypothetical protein